MFIWDKQIKSISPLADQKIPSSLVEFEDGTNQVFTDKNLTYCQTEESLDPSAYTDLIEFHVVQDLISVLEIHDIEATRLDALFRKLASSIKDKEMEAYAHAFGIPGKDPAQVRAMKVRLSDIRRVLGE